MANPFLDTTAVRALGPGRYEGSIDSAWNLNPHPQGGVVTAIALRAMSQELDDPGQGLRSLHTTFAAQVTDGPVSVEVELLRRGRSMSHLRAEVANVANGRGHLTTGIFGSPRAGFDFTDLEPPADVPVPAGLPVVPPASPARRGGLRAHAVLGPAGRGAVGSAIRPGSPTSPTGPNGWCGTGSTSPRSSRTAPPSTRWPWWSWPTPCPAP